MKSKIIRLVIYIAVVAMFFSFLNFTQAVNDIVAFEDNFDDGNADGWQFTFSHDPRHLPPNPYEYGNWRIENGELVQDNGTDHQIALIKGLTFSDQVIEAKVKCNPDAGYAGVTVWYHDVDNWINVFIYPSTGKIWVFPNIEGSGYSSGQLPDPIYGYSFASSCNTWYNLKVEADSDTGYLTVYVDGAEIFTHVVDPTYRAGLSGLNCGNEGSYFDDVKITGSPTSTLILNITSPSNGTIVATPSITITGIASDPSGIESVIVNNTLANGAEDWSTWSAEVTLNQGENTITAIATNNIDTNRTETLTVTYNPLTAPPSLSLSTILSSSYIVDEPITIGVSIENSGITPQDITIEVTTTSGFSDTEIITVQADSTYIENFNIDSISSGLYIATVNLYVDSTLLDSISLPFTVRDPAAVKIADDNAKSLKMSAIDEFDEMAEVPASVSGSMVAQIGIDKLQKYVGDHFGTATDSVQNEDDSGSISDSDVQLITNSANETVDMIYDDISSPTSDFIIWQINERTGTNLPKDTNIFELKESVSSEIYGKIKDVFEELFTGVLKDFVIKPLFTNSEERKVEQRDSEFDLYIQSTSFSLTDAEKTRLTQRFNEGCGAISSVTESKALFIIGPYSIPFVGEFSYAVTLREEKNKFEELEQLGVWIKYIVGALAVTGVVFTLLVSVLGTGGAVLLPLISALPHIITFLKTIMTTMIPVAKSFLLVGMFATVPIIAPEVTLQHDTTLDTVEDIIADIESSLSYSVNINKVTPMSSYIDHPSSITVALDNNEHISVQPITEIMVFSPDGRIIDIQRQDPYIKPHSSTEITEKLHIPSKPGTYNVLGMVHAGGVATSITQQSMPVSKPSLQINLSTDSRIYNIEDTIEIIANFTNNEQSEIGNLTYVIEVINTTSVDADMIVLAASSSQIESISFTPDEEGAYIASAVLLLGFTEVASETIGFTVGSGEALIINTAAEDLYPPESDVTLQIIIDNIGTIHTDSSINITTFDELTDFTQIYTNEIAVSLNPGASTTMHSVALPNAMPGIYRTIIKAGDYSARSVEYTVTANGTIFTLLDTDKLYYNLTDTVNISITTNDILFNATNASVNVSITYPNGTLTYPEVSGSSGNYTAMFDPESNGTYEITASSQKTGFRTYSDETFMITGVRSVLIADLPSNNVLLNRSVFFICNITNEHGTPVENTVVTLNGCGIDITKITDENGMVEFIIMPNATGEISFSAEKGGYAGYTGTVYVFNASGDLDRDGEITSEDVSMALDIVFGDEYVIEADVDENGYVNILDIRMIMQAAAGRIEI